MKITLSRLLTRKQVHDLVLRFSNDTSDVVLFSSRNRCLLEIRRQVVLEIAIIRQTASEPHEAVEFFNFPQGQLISMLQISVYGSPALRIPREPLPGTPEEQWLAIKGLLPRLLRSLEVFDAHQYEPVEGMTRIVELTKPLSGQVVATAIGAVIDGLDDFVAIFHPVWGAFWRRRTRMVAVHRSGAVLVIAPSALTPDGTDVGRRNLAYAFPRLIELFLRRPYSDLYVTPAVCIDAPHIVPRDDLLAASNTLSDALNRSLPHHLR